MSNASASPSLGTASQDQKPGNKRSRQAYEEYFKKLVEIAELNLQQQQAIRTIFDALFKSFKHDFVIWTDPEDIKAHATLLLSTYHHTRKTPTSGYFTKPEYKVVQGNGTVIATRTEIAFKSAIKNDDTLAFDINDARAMALLAANSKTMIDGGITLTGTPKQQDLLRQAIEEINATLLPEQQLRFAGEPAPAPKMSSAKDNSQTSSAPEQKPESQELSPDYKLDTAEQTEEEIAEEISAQQEYMSSEQGQNILKNLKDALKNNDLSHEEKVKQMESILQNEKDFLMHMDSPLFTGKFVQRGDTRLDERALLVDLEEGKTVRVLFVKDGDKIKVVGLPKMNDGPKADVQAEPKPTGTQGTFIKNGKDYTTEATDPAPETTQHESKIAQEQSSASKTQDIERDAPVKRAAKRSAGKDFVQSSANPKKPPRKSASKKHTFNDVSEKDPLTGATGWMATRAAMPPVGMKSLADLLPEEAHMSPPMKLEF